jgi:hypothetical protein
VSIPDIELVLQEHPDGCGIATVAMITGVSYREAWERLAPSPTQQTLADYHARETSFLNEKGWWASSQIVLHTVVGLDGLDAVIDRDPRVKHAAENSHRLRLVMAFADGAKPDHTVVWDRNHKDVVFDPSRGVVHISGLFLPFGEQTYSGTLGMTSFTYQPGQPMQTWVIRETV